MSNEELLEYFEQFNMFYEADFSIDYGEFSGGYPDEYYEVSEAFAAEFEKRGMRVELEEIHA